MKFIIAKKIYQVAVIFMLTGLIIFLPHNINVIDAANTNSQFNFRKSIVNNALKYKGYSTEKTAKWDPSGAADAKHSCATYVSKILQNTGIMKQVCPVVKTLYYKFLSSNALNTEYKAIEVVSPNTPINDPIGHWLEQGDIILFNGSGSLNNGFPHTGIYLGNIDSGGRKIIDTSASSKTVDVRAFPHRGPKSYTAIRIYPKSYTKTPAILKYKQAKKSAGINSDGTILASVTNICQDYLEENPGSQCPLGDDSELKIVDVEDKNTNNNNERYIVLGSLVTVGVGIGFLVLKNKKTKKKGKM